VALSFIDGSTCYNRSLVQAVYDLAKTNDIPIQFKQTATGGNDAGALHLAAGGIKTVSLSVPARYIHSPSSVIARSDYQAMLDLIQCLMKEVQHVYIA